MKNILELLQMTAAALPDKQAVTAPDGACTWRELLHDTERVGTALAAWTAPRHPIPVLMEKGRHALCAFFGAVQAGCFYVPLSPALPEARLRQIVEVLRPPCLVTNQENSELAERLLPGGAVLDIGDLLRTAPDPAALTHIRRGMTGEDPLYCLFTSGSTGTPKGVVISHRAVLDFIPSFTALFGIGAEDVIGNQAPFDFDVSVKDIYGAMQTGATLAIIPRQLFSQPAQLMDFLDESRVTTLTWAVSALCLVSALHGLDYRTPSAVRRVLFSGEVMPPAHLRNWMKHLPQAAFVNLYGPTEITCNCTYHRIESDDIDPAGVPLGRPFPGRRVFLLDEDGREISRTGQTGEICVGGAGLALGYYNAPEQTARFFVQHPDNRRYHERIYRTGDLGQYDAQGALRFCGRRDFQIKHMGHRIELEEIERAAAQLDGVTQCCCIYDEDKSGLHAFYTGTAESAAVFRQLAQCLPVFMLPRTFERLEQLPLTPNGKVDRRRLLAIARRETL
nr:amino acid adenylation domain-containing protein [uncultured Agathobaculum sp.]